MTVHVSNTPSPSITTVEELSPLTVGDRSAVGSDLEQDEEYAQATRRSSTNSTPDIGSGRTSFSGLPEINQDMGSGDFIDVGGNRVYRINSPELHSMISETDCLYTHSPAPSLSINIFARSPKELASIIAGIGKTFSVFSPEDIEKMFGNGGIICSRSIIKDHGITVPDEARCMYIHKSSTCEPIMLQFIGIDFQGTPTSPAKQRMPTSSVRAGQENRTSPGSESDPGDILSVLKKLIKSKTSSSHNEYPENDERSYYSRLSQISSPVLRSNIDSEDDSMEPDITEDISEFEFNEDPGRTENEVEEEESESEGSIEIPNEPVKVRKRKTIDGDDDTNTSTAVASKQKYAGNIVTVEAQVHSVAEIDELD
ncbi:MULTISPECIES: hypothetical protein [Candidatus Ichthyocystis]|uniref:hypothetical protein n=1 Tax=Candidatus Ichthyocystis TaxID=2929841 RepID=UPI000B807316|nr:MULTISPECIES: hypothetical protein [Ichthyocystis]